LKLHLILNKLDELYGKIHSESLTKFMKSQDSSGE